MINVVSMLVLPAVAVGRFGREFQLIIDLVQEVLGFLRMTCQIPFISFLRRHDSIPGLPAQTLRGREIRMPSLRDIPLGSLRYGDTSKNKQGSQNCDENSDSHHGSSL